MRDNYPKLRNIVHAICLWMFFSASEGSNLYILFMLLLLYILHITYTHCQGVTCMAYKRLVDLQRCLIHVTSKICKFFSRKRGYIRDYADTLAGNSIVSCESLASDFENGGFMQNKLIY